MRPRAEGQWIGFNEDLENRCPFLYVDTKMLVTCGIGNLVNTVDAALRLTWMMGDRRATVQEVSDDWHAIWSRRAELANTVAIKQAPYTNVRLTNETIDALVMHQLRANIAYMRKFFPQYDEWSSDAQLGTNSLAWGLGAGLDQTRPEFVTAANRGDWAAAKLHSHLNETKNKGVIPRNAKQRICFDNATTVVRRGLDPAPLWWPNTVPPDADLRTLALKALELGIARESKPPQS
jgi:hypothetical protein